MPLDFVTSEQDIEILWSAFGRYVCAPYKNNPVLLDGIESWFNALYASREQTGLNLSYRYAINYAARRAAFKSFCLNEQMFFSHSANVLSLPHFGIGDADCSYRPDRFICAWLKDLGTSGPENEILLNAHLNRARESGLGVYSTVPPFVTKIPYIDGTINQFMMALGEIISHRIDMREIDWRKSRFRSTVKADRTLAEHRDTSETELAREWFSRSLSMPSTWSRTILHVSRGTGTGYKIGAKEDISLVLPAGFITSHFNGSIDTMRFLNGWGALHWSPLDQNGRQLLILVERRHHYPSRRQDDPWHIMPLIFPKEAPHP